MRRLGRKWIPAVAILYLATFVTVSGTLAEPAGTKTEPSAIQGLKLKPVGAFIRLAGGTLRVEPCGSGVARVSFFRGTVPPRLGNPVIPANTCAAAHYSVDESKQAVELQMPGLVVDVDRATGALSFKDPAGRLLLAESRDPFPRRLSSSRLGRRDALRAATWFALTPEERIYGLGQHQTGLLNERNLQFVLSQDNTNISIPFWLSSKGYGVLWNNASVTDWNNRFQPVLAVQSEVARAVDYFFMAGPGFDRIIAGYRRLTGQAPLMPRWAYGFWQSKLRYASQQELLAVAAKYRKLQIPLDNIVLDEGWETRLGSRVFTPAFPNPAEMVQDLHGEHVHLMVSCWPIFAPPSKAFNELLRHRGFVQLGQYDAPPHFPGARLYDAFSPSARHIYWNQIRKSLYDIGVDAFWLDSTEPLPAFGEEHGPMLAGARTSMGNGSRYANLYPFMTTRAVYRGQRRVSDKRVFLLSRSAFLGMQRHAAAAWSGDTATNFATLKRQIPAGLNYSLTGLPYWTTDIGGFLGGDTKDPAYREVFVRWFEYGAFCPIFRVHGVRTNNENELWSYGRRAQEILTRYDRLRYRLMPYIYSVAARTTFDGYTPMRALVFDFGSDPKALDVNDEFLFGPSILVAPVTEAGATSREVYLPAPARWYDFWTGELLAGGRTVRRLTPLAVMPLYVRAGSILPMIGREEYTGQHPGQPIDLRIYPGSDAAITLYNDDGDTYSYERGQSSRIPIHWNDATETLTIGTRQGSFPGMASGRTFRVVLVSKAHGVGESAARPDRIVQYSGAAIQVAMGSAPRP